MTQRKLLPISKIYFSLWRNETQIVNFFCVYKMTKVKTLPADFEKLDLQQLKELKNNFN
jgi:hypothetical protein